MGEAMEPTSLLEREISQLFLSHGPDARLIVEHFTRDFGGATSIFVLAPASLQDKRDTPQFREMLPEGARVLFVTQSGRLQEGLVTSSDDVCVLNNSSLEQLWAMARLSHDHCKAVVLELCPDGTGTWRSLFTADRDLGQLMGL